MLLLDETIEGKYFLKYSWVLYLKIDLKDLAVLKWKTHLEDVNNQSQTDCFWHR